MAVLAGGRARPHAGQNHHFGVYAPKKLPYAIARYDNETNRLHGVLDHRLADHSFVAGGEYTVADMAAYPGIASWTRQQQDLDSFRHVHRWFDAVRARPATVWACAKGEAFTQPAVTEEDKKLLFGQTAANTVNASTAGSAPA